MGEVEANGLDRALAGGPGGLPQPGSLATALGTDDFASASQTDIDVAAQGSPALERLVGTDVDGWPRSPSPTCVCTRSRTRSGWNLPSLPCATLPSQPRVGWRGSSLSSATVSEETSEAVGPQMMQLMILALVVIAALLFLFTRSLFDLLLSLLGLVITIVWVLGAQGWLGPNGAGLIGAPNTLTTMVPIMLIGLVVDYAIQTVGLYRERRNEGEAVRPAVRSGLRSVIIPLALAAVTTIVSFLTNLTSPIPANGDFGVVAGVSAWASAWS